jgi:hypothetical protein
MSRTGNVMWAGPLLPVGFDPALKVKANVQPERMAAGEKRAGDRSPAPGVHELMTWNGPLSPDQVD